MQEDPNLNGFPVIKTYEADPLAQRLEAIERFGDAILRWVVTLTATACIAAVSAAYVAQYLAGK